VLGFTQSKRGKKSRFHRLTQPEEATADKSFAPEPHNHFSLMPASQRRRIQFAFSLPIISFPNIDAAGIPAHTRRMVKKSSGAL
jgi:hypothetical protein